MEKMFVCYFIEFGIIEPNLVRFKRSTNQKYPLFNYWLQYKQFICETWPVCAKFACEKK